MHHRLPEFGSSTNRGKRSVALDLKDPEGRELALELCARADVVIENFRPGGAARLGLDYDAVRRRRSDVVYCTINGFGRREPRDRPGYDFVIQAESGLMSITGERGRRADRDLVARQRFRGARQRRRERARDRR
jgi:crotonobetainyl-CoA:carnitine CoA-transferase CaiB-like acyl-CoA transferase